MSVAAAVPSAPSSAPSLCVLACSKDRAWQCGQLLRSLEASAAPALAASAESSSEAAEEHVRLDVAVVYTTSSIGHERSYEALREQWPQVRFVRETPFDVDQATTTPAASAAVPPADVAGSATVAPATPFADLVLSLVSGWQAAVSADSSAAPRHIMLAVDDMLFYSPRLPFRSLLRTLDEDPQMLAAHLALHPGVNFCHPANRAARVPPMLQPVDAVATQAAERGEIHVMRFMRLLGTCDWNYPFSLCGSIYRLEDIVELLHHVDLLKGPPSRAHPNSFEVVGNQVATQGRKVKDALALPPDTPSEIEQGLLVPLASRRPWSCCLSAPVLSVVTINRVQDMFLNPIYTPTTAAVPAKVEAEATNLSLDSLALASPPAAAAASSSSSSDASASSVPVDLSADELLLLSQAQPDLAFDLPRYLRESSRFRSVHIGDFFTTTRAAAMVSVEQE